MKDRTRQAIALLVKNKYYPQAVERQSRIVVKDYAEKILSARVSALGIHLYDETGFYKTLEW